MKKLFLKSSSFHLLLTVTASTLIAALFARSQFGTMVERETLDWRMRAAWDARRPDRSVVIAAIDQKSLNFFQKNGVAWPWPREFYGILLDYLHKGGAKAVAFDIDFSQKDMDRLNVSGRASDSSFASSITKNGSVVLVTVLTSSRDSSASTGTEIDPAFFLPAIRAGIFEPRFKSCIAPRGEFQKGASAIGVANFFVDVDGVARRIPLLFRLNNEILPQLSLAAYTVGKRLTNSTLGNFIRTIPTDRDGSYLINWYGRGGPNGEFKYYSIAALIESAVQMKQGLRPEIPPTVFRDKYIIVGGTAVGLMDYVSTPFTGQHPFPGVEIDATILSNFLQHYYLTEMPPFFTLIIIIALSLLAAGSFYGSRKVMVSTTVVLASCGIYLLAAFLLMSIRRFWLPIVAPEIAALTAFAFAGVISYVTEGRRRRELRKLLNRYISPAVVDEISLYPDTADFKGREIEATVFFSDIRQFTALSEQLQPRELVENLNEYFNLATELILNNGAMLDKYIGDAIMAVFGAPLPKEDHAVKACLTALQIQNVLLDHYSRRGDDKPVFETRIGLNSGRMVIGNIGSERRMDYTVIGDSVNLASRLEVVNKEFGTRIIISQSTYEKAEHAIETRELDLVRVRGKDIPVRIFELIAEKGVLHRDVISLYEMFHEGLEYYRQKEWKRAEGLFQRVLERKPDDGPSRMYVDRCRTLIETGVPDEWDGIYKSDAK